ncbi:cartilage intermediate layer protein 1-like isoform X2 [Ruditapes philippinarum]|uniref:cartilage intermediate layer protein 1-like isoform X2 n=1 Tax=Ruditapes philippinarum TaxID=129788 RepID=UPI00295B764B|nr:cartilage intermediate layer protein 1-like isoform X2 [Ruditapes philippinarum]
MKKALANKKAKYIVSRKDRGESAFTEHGESEDRPTGFGPSSSTLEKRSKIKYSLIVLAVVCVCSVAIPLIVIFHNDITDENTGSSTISPNDAEMEESSTEPSGNSTRKGTEETTSQSPTSLAKTTMTKSVTTTQPDSTEVTSTAGNVESTTEPSGNSTNEGTEETTSQGPTSLAKTTATKSMTTTQQEVSGNPTSGETTEETTSQGPTSLLKTTATKSMTTTQPDSSEVTSTAGKVESTTVSHISTTMNITQTGFWSPWGVWTLCTVTCNYGIQTRYRTCNSTGCIGEIVEKKNCVEKKCPVYGKWSSWSQWGSCDVTCGGGKQIRSRVCSKLSSDDRECVGISSQNKTCSEWKCPDCNRICAKGNINDKCDACICEGSVLTGRVLAANTGHPVSNVAFYAITSPTDLLVESNSTGFFTLENVCTDTEILLSRPGFVDRTVRVTGAHMLVNMSKLVLPYLTETPQSKSRLVGENVTLCCKAVASPAIVNYEWLKDGLILEEHLYTEGNKLNLFSLSVTDSGIYQCRANSRAGAIMSPTSKLIVKETADHFCSDALQQKSIALPDDCVQQSTNTAKYNVGECIAKSCRENSTFDSGSCHDDTTSCCTIGESKLEKIMCSGYELDVIVVTSCSCRSCISNSLTIYGTARGLEDGFPLKYGEVFVNGVFITFTSSSGTFSFVASKDSPKITLNLRDVYIKRFLPAVKVIEINDNLKGVLRVEIQMIQKAEPVQIDSSTENSLIIGKSPLSSPVHVSVPANAFYLQNGSEYVGTVQASLAFIDPTDISNFNNVPGSLEIVDEEGQRAELASQAIFNLNFEDSSGNPLVLDEVIDLYLPDDVSTNIGDKGVQLWGLNTETGIWENIAHGTGKRRRKKQSSRWIGEIDWSIISDFDWFNYDYVEQVTQKPCYFKIRLFQDEKLLTTVVNPEKLIEVRSHILRDNKTTLRTVSDFLFSPENECIIGICEDEYAYITLHYFGRKGDELLFAGLPKIVQGISNYELMDNNNTLKIQMSLSSIGPFYENETQCMVSGKDENHLRYHYGETTELFTYNKFYSPSQGDQMQKLMEQRTWYRQHTQIGYKVCFIKVRILIEVAYLYPGQYIKLRATSKGGTNENTQNFTFGIREHYVQNLEDTTFCVEYKCSVQLETEEMNDYTKLEIKLIYPQSEFTSNLTREEDFITNFPDLQNAAQIGRRDGIFEIYVPAVYTDPDLGLYAGLSDMLDIDRATNTARGECISGKPHKQNENNPELGVAIFFSLK